MPSQRKRTESEQIFNGLIAKAENSFFIKIGDLYRKSALENPNSLDVNFGENQKKELSEIFKNYGKVVKEKLIYNTNSNFESPTTKKAKKGLAGVNVGQLGLANKKQSFLDKIQEATNMTFQTLQQQMIGKNFNYCGSGTDILGYLEKGLIPANIVDYHCMIHDLEYLTIGAYGLKDEARRKAEIKADNNLSTSVSEYAVLVDPKNKRLSLLADAALKVKAGMVGAGILRSFTSNSVFVTQYNKLKNREEAKKNSFNELATVLTSQYSKALIKEADGVDALEKYEGSIEILKELNKKLGDDKSSLESDKGYDRKRELSILKQTEGNINYDVLLSESKVVSKTDDAVFTSKELGIVKLPELSDLERKTLATSANDPFAEDRPPRAPAVEVAPGVEIEDEEGLGDIEPAGAGVPIGAGEEVKEEEVKEGEGQVVPAGGQLVEATPIDLEELKKQRDRVGQFQRSDINIQQKRGDPPLNTMGLTDAKPVVGERNMRPLLFREEGDTVELTKFEENENRLFYENFTWIDAGFGNGNIQRLPGSMYAGKDLANNRLYDAQIRNETLKYSGRLFTGPQQYRKKYDISAQTRKLIEVPMFSTVQNHQEFIRDSSLPAGAGRPHQMARDEVSFIRRKNVNNKVGRLFYPDLVDGKHL